MQSFQKEVPKARVNIFLDANSDHHLLSKELPLKQLFLGSFSGRTQTTKIAMRPRYPVCSETLDDVLSLIQPNLYCVIQEHAGRPPQELHLTFSSMKDFHPEGLVKRVPSLRRMVAMRALLKDLKSRLMRDEQLRAILNELSVGKGSLRKLFETLKSLPVEEDKDVVRSLG